MDERCARGRGESQFGAVDAGGRTGVGGTIARTIGSIGCAAIAIVLLIAGGAWMIYAILNRPAAVVTLTRDSEPLAE